MRAAEGGGGCGGWSRWQNETVGGEGEEQQGDKGAGLEDGRTSNANALRKACAGLRHCASSATTAAAATTAALSERREGRQLPGSAVRRACLLTLRPGAL